MSRAINLNGVPVAKLPRKKKPARKPVPMQAEVTHNYNVSTVSTYTFPPQHRYPFAEATLTQAHLDATDEEPWAKRMKERRRNKAEFGHPVLDHELPAKFRKKREKEKANET